MSVDMQRHGGATGKTVQLLPLQASLRWRSVTPLDSSPNCCASRLAAASVWEKIEAKRLPPPSLIPPLCCCGVHLSQWAVSEPLDPTKLTAWGCGFQAAQHSHTRYYRGTWSTRRKYSANE